MKGTPRPAARLTLCFALLLLSVSVAWPQAGTGTVSGTVRDQSGAVVPAAGVSLRNTATNVTLKTTANEVGFYMFAAVTPGPYALAAEASGMQKFEGTLTVQVQQSAVVDVTLKVGQTTAEVTVQDLTPMVTVDSPTLGHVLERSRIEQLPINGRAVESLLQTVPGMEGNRAYAQKTGSQDMVLDGAAIGDRLWGYTNVRRPPGLDTIEEFKVENNNSSAKFTRPTTVILTTKSGTNQLHGTVFETDRNAAIGTARSRTDTWTQPPFLVRNEFGASGGGPVYIPKLYNGKDRTFWFASYEGARNYARRKWDGEVPTAEMRNGDFSGLVDDRGNLSRLYDPWTTDTQTWVRQPFPNNTIPASRISPLAKYLIGVTPLPTMPDVNPMLDSNWWGVGPDWRRQWTVTSRIDHRISDNDRFFVRYTQGNDVSVAQDWNIPYLDGVAGSVRRWGPMWNMSTSYVRTFSPTLFNELLASVAHDQRWKGTGEPGVKYSDQLGLPNPFNVEGWPGIYDAGFSGQYWETDNTQGSPFTYAILDDNATKIHGRHEFQFGFHFRYDQLNILPDQQQPQGNHSFATLGTALYDPTTSRTNPGSTPYTGHNMGNMYLGIMNYSNSFVRGYFYARGREYASYFQDNYRVSSRLTLNLGVRWEYWPAYREKRNFFTGFSFDQRAIVTGNPLDEMYRLQQTIPSIVSRYEQLGAKFITYKDAGLPQTFMDDNYRNLGPRLGFAYRLGQGNRAFVLRGGYRLSYFPLPLRGWASIMRGNAPGTARFRTNQNDSSLSPDGIGNYMMRSVPTIVAGQNSRNAVSLQNASGLNRGSATSNFFDRSQPTSRTHDWNLTLERELMQNTVARIAYVGNHGAYLEQWQAFNSSVPDYIWYATTGQPLPTGEYSSVARRNWDQTVYGGIQKYAKTGYSNYHGVQMELERRFTRGYGFQLYYVLSNPMTLSAMADQGNSIAEVNQFLPGAVPADMEQRDRFLNYQRDTGIPKHRVRWNWVVDLPFGKGKPLFRNAGGILDRIVGGWQLAGMGSLASTYFPLPTGIYPNGNKIELYGYKYPIEDCTSGKCYPGYLWWNGYIPADKINSHDAAGKPNGYMGIPADYKPAGEPLIPWPKNPNKSDPNYSWYGTNTVWIPLKNGVTQRIAYNNNLHPWRQQYFPSVRQWGLDASLFKRVAITERLSLRLNGDFFNVLNHPGNPNSLTTANALSTAGVLSVRNSGSGARQVQVTARLTW